MKLAFVVATGLGMGLAAQVAGAVTPLSELDTSPDVTTTITGKTVADENVLADDLAGTTALIDLAIPKEADLEAYELLPGGDVLFSLDITVKLPGNVIAEPRDVVRFTPATTTYAVIFDGSALGIPDGARIDAIALDGAKLLLSFDVSVTFSLFTVEDEDVVAYDPTSGLFSPAFDGSAAGIDRTLDVDGLARLSNGHLLVSFDTSGTVGGVPFDDEDVLEFTGPPPGAWEMAYDGTLVDPNWAAADLDVVAAAVPTDDADGDGVPDVLDNCPKAPNPGQQDHGGVGFGSAPDGIGDDCQCGDASGDGVVTAVDAVVIARSLLIPPTATVARPALCDVGAGSPNAATLDCSLADAVVIRRAQLNPPTATVQQTCPAADGTP
jgi:hypothetical protein